MVVLRIILRILLVLLLPVIVLLCLLIFLLLSLLRFGVIFEYGSLGLKVWTKFGFLKFNHSGDGKRKKPKKKKKSGKEFDVKQFRETVLSDFKDLTFILATLKKILGRLRRRLLIKELTFHCAFAGDDASKIALTSGRVNAAVGCLLPILKRNLRIRRHDLRIFGNFESDKTEIYAKVRASIAVWEVFYIIAPVVPMLMKIFFKRA